MRNKKITLKLILLTIAGGMVFFLISFGSFYTYWNSAPAEKTCASCHEIQSSVHTHAMSSHRNLQCKECHGTALSNGMHSLKEKGMMVVNHVLKNRVENIKMNENQMLDVMTNCKRCHASEFANWNSSGHSAKYKDIFLDKKHNKTEQLNFDCLRCHGMYFEGQIADVVEPLSTEGPWKMKNEDMALKPTIPCLSCHQVHQNGEPAKNPDYSNPKSVFYYKKHKNTQLTFYDRHEKTHFSMSDLPEMTLFADNKQVKVSADPRMKNCVQCHAPAATHRAGTGDDKTPRGVHEGLSCLDCHDPHSNDAKNSCTKCHPAISNCKLDVRKMNTTYANSKSQHNIHFVSCTDCHDGKQEKKLNL